MNSKNKTVILTMAMAVAFAVTGCGNKQSADTSPAVSSSSETNETVVASDAADDTSEAADMNTNSGENSNILIAYFSVMETDGADTVASASRIAVDGKTVGNNEYLASLIQQEIGGGIKLSNSENTGGAKVEIFFLSSQETR